MEGQLLKYPATGKVTKNTISYFYHVIFSGYKKTAQKSLRFKRKQWPRPRLPYGLAIWLCHMALPYGLAIWLCQIALPYGFATWLCHMALPYGFAIWLCHMALPYGSAIWLCHMALSYGSAIWPCHMALPYIDSYFFSNEIDFARGYAQNEFS